MSWRSLAALLAAALLAYAAVASGASISITALDTGGGTSLIAFVVSGTAAADAPLIISVPGQDHGCSSLRHALYESGPFVFDGGGGVVENAHAWTEPPFGFALAYLERPAGDAAAVSGARVAAAVRALLAGAPELVRRDVLLLGSEGGARVVVEAAWAVAGAGGARVRGVVTARALVDPLRDLNATFAFLNSIGVLDQWDLAALRRDLALAAAARDKGDVREARDRHAELRRQLAARHGGLALADAREAGRFGPAAGVARMYEAAGIANAGPLAVACADGTEDDVGWDPEVFVPLAAPLLAAANASLPALALGGQWDWGAPPVTLEGLFDSRAAGKQPLVGAGGQKVGFTKQAGAVEAALLMEASGFPGREYPDLVAARLHRLLALPRPAAPPRTRALHPAPTPPPASPAASPRRRPPLPRPAFLASSRRPAWRPAGGPPPPGPAVQRTAQQRRALAQSATCVSSLPTMPQELAAMYGSGCRMKTGYLTAAIATRRDLLSSLFYWFIEARSGDAASPVLLWLNGGPGCSSMFGLLHENGPFEVASDGTLRARESGWNQHNALLYIDQPVHTGFSQVGGNAYVRTSEEAGELLYESLQQLYDGSPELRQRRLVIAGESYAGHYIPAFAHYILQGNAAGRASVPLDGLAIGNAWIDAGPQLTGYVDMYHALGYLDAGEREALAAQEGRATAACGRGDALGCSQATDVLLGGIAAAATASFDLDDLREPDEPRDALAAFLNRNDVQAALRTAAGASWRECDDPPFDAMYEDQSRPLSPLLDGVIARGLRVLLYSGNFDGNVPATTEENVINALKAAAAGALRAAPHGSLPWRIDGRLVGWVRRAGPALAWVRVFGAGHMVPTDQPAAALELIERFLWHADYTDGPSGKAYETAAATQGPSGLGGAAEKRGLPPWAIALVALFAAAAAVGCLTAVALIVRARRSRVADGARGAVAFNVYRATEEGLHLREADLELHALPEFGREAPANPKRPPPLAAAVDADDDALDRI